MLTNHVLRTIYLHERWRRKMQPVKPATQSCVLVSLKGPQTLAPGSALQQSLLRHCCVTFADWLSASRQVTTDLAPAAQGRDRKQG